MKRIDSGVSAPFASANLCFSVNARINCSAHVVPTYLERVRAHEQRRGERLVVQQRLQHLAVELRRQQRVQLRVDREPRLSA